MRSIFAGIAAAWFAYHALTFLPAGVYANDGAPGGLDGESVNLAIMWACANRSSPAWPSSPWRSWTGPGSCAGTASCAATT